MYLLIWSSRRMPAWGLWSMSEWMKRILTKWDCFWISWTVRFVSWIWTGADCFRKYPGRKNSFVSWKKEKSQNFRKISDPIWNKMGLILYMVWNGLGKMEEHLRKTKHSLEKIHFYPIQFWWKEIYSNVFIKMRKNFTPVFLFPLLWKKIWKQYRRIQTGSLQHTEMSTFMWCSINISLIEKNWSECWKKSRKISINCGKRQEKKNRIWIFTGDIKHALSSRHSAVRYIRRQKKIS